jgi:hypothetical protein
VACDSGSVLGCAIATFPWIIAVLALVVAILVALRVAAYLRERYAFDGEDEFVPAHAGGPGGGPRPADAAPAGSQPAKPQPKPTPLQLRLDDKPDLGLAHFHSAETQADFGEIVTSVILSLDGWKQLPSKMQGGRGLDGLFVREVRGGGGFEVLAVETKVNNAPYNPMSMSDVKLLEDIGELYAGGVLSKPLADEMNRGLRQGSSFFRKELWRHDLSNGLTTISELSRSGEKGRAVTRSCARLMSALYLSLEQLDREAVYFGRQSVDAV